MYGVADCFVRAAIQGRLDYIDRAMQGISSSLAITLIGYLREFTTYTCARTIFSELQFLQEV